ncbi:MAG: hypothetical protein ACFFB0_08475 [Promethearchaeota archaeon]
MEEVSATANKLSVLAEGLRNNLTNLEEAKLINEKNKEKGALK